MLPPQPLLPQAPVECIKPPYHCKSNPSVILDRGIFTLIFTQ